MTSCQFTASVRGSDLSFPRCYLHFDFLEFHRPRVGSDQDKEPLPFHWSCLVESTFECRDLISFVDTRGDDPALDFIESLLTQLPSSGPVIVAAHRERPVLVWLGQAYADMTEGVTGVIARLLELHPVGGSTRTGILERPGVYAKGMMGGALGDDIDAADAYRELVGSSRRQITRRSGLAALIEYGERQTTSLWRMVSQDSGVLIPPDPHWPAAGGGGFVLN